MSLEEDTHRVRKRGDGLGSCRWGGTSIREGKRLPIRNVKRVSRGRNRLGKEDIVRRHTRGETVERKPRSEGPQ